MKDLPVRILSAIVLVAGVVYLVGYAPEWSFVLAQTLMLAVMIWELATMLATKYYVGSRFAPLVAGLAWNSLHFFPQYAEQAATGLLIAIICFAMWQRAPMPQRLQCLLTVLLASVYPAVLWRHLLSIHETLGGVLILFHLILVNSSTDIGAYFGGKLLGRHRLSPLLSPKKTWEGLIAGAVTATAVSVWAGGEWIRLHVHSSALTAPMHAPRLDPWQCIWLGLAIAVLGQVSDLAESLIKRACGVKDSGSFIPGHGGVLDRCDSLLFNIPLVYYYWLYVGAKPILS